MEIPIAIVIPAFNQFEYCRQCIESIQRNTQRAYRLILVDNASTDGVGAYFDALAAAHEEVVALHSAENLGFAGGVNLGLREVKEGHVVVLNSDTLTPSGWLGHLEQLLLSEADIGMLGPMSNCVSGGQQIDDLEFQSLEAITAYAQDLRSQSGKKLRDVARLVGFCLLIRDQVLQEVGLFDEGFGLGNFEDDDYCLRVLRAGYRLCVAESSFVFHYGSRTFLGMGLVGEAWQALMAKNQAFFEAKWDARVEERNDQFQESHQLNRRAREAVEAGSLKEAFDLFSQAIKIAPAYDQNYNDLGAVLWRMGKGEEALVCFERALRLNPKASETRYNYEQASAALGKEAQAEAFLRALEGATKEQP